LKEAGVVGETPITMTYDITGNILTRSDVGTYHYNDIDGGPQAVSSITGLKPNTYNYDNAGNRWFSSDGFIAYSSSGKVISIDKAPKRMEFDLGPDDQRVEERTFNGATQTERKVYAEP